MNESNNLYISSRGILNSCNYRSNTPVSSIRQMINYCYVYFDKHQRTHTVYVCSTAIPHFITHMLPTISHPFILVSGDCDEIMPYDVLPGDKFDEFINNPLIIHWFCQNMVIKHSKMTCIPIGLDYHTMVNNRVWGDITSAFEQEKQLQLIKHDSLHFSKRTVKCYANFHFLMTTKYGKHDRQDAYDNIDKNLVYYEPEKINRLSTWMTQTKYAFVVSPHGNGYDCHRTWEALILGCIPIVKTSAIDVLYDDLPVLIVADWKDVTMELLHNTIDSYQQKVFNFNRLTLKYWMDKINMICP